MPVSANGAILKLSNSCSSGTGSFRRSTSVLNPFDVVPHRVHVLQETLDSPTLFFFSFPKLNYTRTLTNTPVQQSNYYTRNTERAIPQDILRHWQTTTTEQILNILSRQLMPSGAETPKEKLLSPGSKWQPFTFRRV